MKLMVNRTLIAFILLTLAGSAVYAKSNTTNVTFMSDINVGGTLVKKGTYDIKFDDQTSELSILRHGKEIAKATARTEKREHKAGQTELRVDTNGAQPRLVSIAFGGSDQNVLVP